ncbi:hypothetical protein IID22_00005 [Patescibacteria group bacterium]|nr:hypothetical protein [Patescibacteria group bacterium]
MKKYPAASDKDTLNHYIETFGDYDLSLFYEEPEFVAYVFLNEGLVVVAHQGERGNVYELRYFVPTSEEEFLETWGSDLLTEPPRKPPLYY